MSTVQKIITVIILILNSMCIGGLITAQILSDSYTFITSMVITSCIFAVYLNAYNLIKD